MQEEFHESIKSEVEGEPGTLRMNRKSSIIHEEVGNASHRSQSQIDVDSELKESGGEGRQDSPIKEEPRENKTPWDDNTKRVGDGNLVT